MFACSGELESVYTCRLEGGDRVRVVGNLVMVINSFWLHSKAMI